MALWAWIALLVLALLVILGDLQGKARYGDKYKFDEGVDR